ncbi:Adenylate cyclase type 10 [Phlyctochytrium planicorne]|nr:Adenylate cyclase type 10 [Phlyctochytrium planicorne]
MVQQRFGSVIKLAGDSAIVAWSISALTREKGWNLHAAGSEVLAIQTACRLAVLCCLELLEHFEDYSINIESHPGGINPISAEDSLAAKFAPDQPSKLVKKLRLHIGLGLGEIHHVFVGHQSESDCQRRRAEYFIAGRSLLDAGINLNKGKSGQLVCHNRLIMESMPSLIHPPEESVSETTAIDVQSDTFFTLKTFLLAEIAGLFTMESKGCPGDTHVPVDERTIDFIEPSLTKHLVFSGKNEIAPSQEKTNEALLDNINQYRTITSIFIQLPNIPIDRIGSSKRVLEDVQFLARLVCEISQHNGGTCRQIHADEKALLALIVWGIEGFSHEKGDHIYAVTAAMEMEKRLRTRRWWWQDLEDKLDDIPKRSCDFSLALTMGKAFCGIIGATTRFEGTVLGPSINRAARIMCNASCAGRLLCDEFVARACTDLVEFSDAGSIIAKVKIGQGIKLPVQVFSPLKIKAFQVDSIPNDVILEGRGDEIQALSDLVENWMTSEGKSKPTAMVVGKSGSDAHWTSYNARSISFVDDIADENKAKIEFFRSFGVKESNLRISAKEKPNVVGAVVQTEQKF